MVLDAFIFIISIVFLFILYEVLLRFSFKINGFNPSKSNFAFSTVAILFNTMSFFLRDIYYLMIILLLELFVLFNTLRYGYALSVKNTFKIFIVWLLGLISIALSCILIIYLFGFFK